MAVVLQLGDLGPEDGQQPPNPCLNHVIGAGVMSYMAMLSKDPDTLVDLVLVGEAGAGGGGCIGSSTLPPISYNFSVRSLKMSLAALQIRFPHRCGSWVTC